VDADGSDADLPDQFATAYSETAEPTAEAIGDLICAALKNAVTILGNTTPDRFGSSPPPSTCPISSPAPEPNPPAG
jgi:hypothetical protein